MAGNPSAAPITTPPTITLAPTGSYCGDIIKPGGKCDEYPELLLGYGLGVHECARLVEDHPDCGNTIMFSELHNDEFGCWCCQKSENWYGGGDPSAAPTALGDCPAFLVNPETCRAGWNLALGPSSTRVEGPFP